MAHNEHIRLKKIVIFLTIWWKCDFVSFGFNLSSWFWFIICYSRGRFRDVILEEDLEIVINGLKNEDASFAFYGHFVKEKQSLVESFTVFCFSHIKR